MGVDATIYVVADYSSGDWMYGSATIDLCRRCDDWPVLESLPVARMCRRIHLQQASFCRLGDGTKPQGDDRESGYLFGDSYRPDAGFHVYRVADLAATADRISDANRGIVDFVCRQYPDHEFIVIWH